MMKWNELLFSLIVTLSCEFSAFPVLFYSIIVETKLKNHPPADLISDFSENSTLEFVIFYQ